MQVNEIPEALGPRFCECLSVVIAFYVLQTNINKTIIGEYNLTTTTNTTTTNQQIALPQHQVQIIISIEG